MSFEYEFIISGILTIVNLLLLYYFNDEEMKSKKTIEYESRKGGMEKIEMISIET